MQNWVLYAKLLFWGQVCSPPVSMFVNGWVGHDLECVGLEWLIKCFQKQIVKALKESKGGSR